MNRYSQILLYLESLSDQELQQLLNEKLGPIQPIQQEQNQEKKHRKIIIEEILLELHHNPANLGFEYIEKAIDICLQDAEILKSITKRLYPEVAQIVGSKANRVERAIRRTIETSWERLSIEKRQEVFFNQIEKPTNSQYISYICRYIQNIEKQQTYETQKVLR